MANKSLWTLVSGPSLHTERDVIRSELESQADSLFEVGVEFTMIQMVIILVQGLLGYKPNTKETAEAFKKKKGISENLRGFVFKLSKVICVDEGQSWELLCQYLAR